jgi:predicted acylesterase/phospholipase RssA
MSMSFKRFVAMVFAALACPPRASAVEPRPVAMVINGGISLGAYQAGVTTALMRFVVARRDGGDALAGAAGPLLEAAPLDFQIATGSSAGNINAFLAALTWCAQEPLELRRNLFWDSWINIGLDKLSPVEPRQKEYQRLFTSPDASPDFPRDPALLRPPPDAWQPDRSVYSREDGLLTRRAFLAALAHLERRLALPRYRQCLVKVGITVTRADVVRLAGAATQRFVVPLELGTRDCGPDGAGCRIRIGNHLPWLLAGDGHRAIGKFMMLPQTQALEIPRPAIFDLVSASSAFPVAFAPQRLDRCAPPDEPIRRVGPTPPRDATRCPPGLVMGAERYIDGGLFDNIPLGLAIELDRSRTAGRPPVFLYVDDSKRRAPVDLTPRAPRSSGLGALWGTLGNFVGQTRQYELQGLARYRSAEAGFTDGRFFATSRLLPVSASYLGAFGAFPVIAFRKVDYYIGVYDGIRSLAGPSREAFEAIQELVLARDAELTAFTSNLREYEEYWTGLAGTVAPRDRCDVPALTEPAVRETFRVLCQIDEKGRVLARSGSPAEIARFRDEEAGYDALVRRSGALAELGGDFSEWQHAEIDRLLRRALDVERADDRALRPGSVRPDSLARELDSATIRSVLLVGRLALASSIERAETSLFTSSSVARASAHQCDVRAALAHLFPYFLVWDSVNSRAEIGWELTLRLPRRLMLGLDPALLWDPHLPDHRWGLRTVLGLGYDPRGRLVDDLQLGVGAWTASRDFEATFRDVRDRLPASLGLEASIHLLGSKLRLAVGAPALIGRRTPQTWHWGRTDGRFATLLDGFYFSIGFADVSGTVAWLLRAAPTQLLRTCEQRCEDDE